MNHLVKAYSTCDLCDLGDSAERLIKTTISKLSEGFDHFSITKQAHYIVVRHDTRLPWLFYSELEKSIRLWNARNDVRESFFAVEFSNNMCLVNRYVLLNKGCFLVLPEDQVSR